MDLGDSFFDGQPEFDAAEMIQEAVRGMAPERRAALLRELRACFQNGEFPWDADDGDATGVRNQGPNEPDRPPRGGSATQLRH